jgi:dTDP-4-dehydrorhamnose 3,5-epimerase
MQVVASSIPDVKVLVPVRHRDARGYFSEAFNRRALAEAGIDNDFLQDNHLLSGPPGTIRGLHYQLAPFAQAKLLRVLRGSVLDVAVDIREDSATFGQHVTEVISAEAGNQIFVPAGFAHGFCTLEPDTEVLYKVDQYWAPDHDRGLCWNDPDLAIKWPEAASESLLSERDRHQPSFRETFGALARRSTGK